jgi:hypothetical protein
MHMTDARIVWTVRQAKMRPANVADMWLLRKADKLSDREIRLVNATYHRLAN